MTVSAFRFFIALCEALVLAACSSAPGEGTVDIILLPPPGGFVAGQPATNEYVKTMAARIKEQWYSVLKNLNPAPAPGSSVMVIFKLYPDGRAEILHVDNHGAGKIGVLAAVSAIGNFQPYPAWTSEMIEALGNEQTITLSFNYR